jgi:hypothetical protein
LTDLVTGANVHGKESEGVASKWTVIRFLVVSGSAYKRSGRNRVRSVMGVPEYPVAEQNAL